MSHEAVQFYPLEEEYLISNRFLIFAEWIIGFVEFAICVSPGEMNGIVIRVLNGDTGCKVSNNFEEFSEKYLEDSMDIYAPNEAVVQLL